MQVLVCPNNFKESFSASEVAKIMEEAIMSGRKKYTCIVQPLADGGEGTAELLSAASGGNMVTVSASDPMFRPISCKFGINTETREAWISLAEASGLTRLTMAERNPIRTTTLGTGQLIAGAITRGSKKIFLGLGDSATMDCGIGIAHALGFRFLDKEGEVLPPMAGSLGRIAHIDGSRATFRPDNTELVLLYDVKNPLLGEEGVQLFGPQKGLKLKEDIATIDFNISEYAAFIENRFGIRAEMPGMGAAGGAALTCIALLGAKLMPGTDYIFEKLGLKDKIAASDLVISGEGRLDRQSMGGKVLPALSRLVHAAGKPLAMIAGQSELDDQEVKKAGIDELEVLFKMVPDKETMIAKTPEKIQKAVRSVLKKLG